MLIVCTDLNLMCLSAFYEVVKAQLEKELLKTGFVLVTVNSGIIFFRVFSGNFVNGSFFVHIAALFAS